MAQPHVTDATVCDPRHNHHISRHHHKCDEEDGYRLAHLHRLGALKKVWQPTSDARAVFKCAVCSQWAEDPRSGHLFLFCNEARNRLKVYCFDGTGAWVCAKGLERGRKVRLRAGGVGAASGRIGNDARGAPQLVAGGVKNTRMFIGFFASFSPLFQGGIARLLGGGQHGRNARSHHASRPASRAVCRGPRRA